MHQAAGAAGAVSYSSALTGYSPPLERRDTLAPKLDEAGRFAADVQMVLRWDSVAVVDEKERKAE